MEFWLFYRKGDGYCISGLPFWYDLVKIISKFFTRSMKHPIFARAFICVACLTFSALAVLAQNNITLAVDATQAAKNIVHVKETVDARPGTLDLFYPKWIPGEHSPTGTINDVVNLYFLADGKPLEWQRDPVEMFAFHVTVPDGVTRIEVDFDDVSQPGTVATANLARVKWNRLL